MPPSSLLYALDAEQHQAVTAPADAVIVLAGAGSGKTTVLTQRIYYRIDNATADAEHTLAITFTREAAAQLRRRTPRGIQTGTFHAIAFALLRQRYTDQGRPLPTVLTNRYGIVNESIKFIRSRVNINEALGELEWLQARALTPQAYTAAATAAKRTTTAKPEDLEKVFSEYEKTKIKRGVVDLGDLLSRTTHDIANDFEYAEATRWRYRHLLVDEAQDMNPQQFAFFSALRGKNRDVFVVGDPLQSIYGWNGAEPSLFDTLPEKLGGAHIVHLVNNYRCSPVIVAAGLHVLTNNGIPATARSTKLDGEAITIQGYANEHDEANGIALLATQAHRSLARWSDIAVLVRTNTQREIVAGALKKHHIPVLTRGQSAVIAPLLQEVAALTHRYALADWALELRMASEPDSPEFLLSEQVNEFLQDHPTGAAHGSMFMSWLSTVGQRTNLGEDGIELLTFHAAKGREWNTVFIAGAEQGLLPHSSSRTAAQKAEEVRLAYVAITRAAEKLFVTHAAERNSRKANPSKYFVNLPLGETTTARMPEEIMEYAKAVSAATPKGALRAWRKERARQLNTTEVGVCNDAILARLEKELPTSSEELASIFGALTAESLAPSLLPLLAQFTAPNTK
jgi:DNA helicase-2/ATP-dependent DNA helicase PcrA